MKFTKKYCKLRIRLPSIQLKFLNVKMNYYYRPNDIKGSIITLNSGKVYTSLHEDICPTHLYRGGYTVINKAGLEEVLPTKREEIVIFRCILFRFFVWQICLPIL